MPESPASSNSRWTGLSGRQRGLKRLNEIVFTRKNKSLCVVCPKIPLSSVTLRWSQAVTLNGRRWCCWCGQFDLVAPALSFSSAGRSKIFNPISISILLRFGFDTILRFYYSNRSRNLTPSEIRSISSVEKFSLKTSMGLSRHKRTADGPIGRKFNLKIWANFGDFPERTHCERI